jgi:hypothetical protein
MSIEQDSISVQSSEAFGNVQILRGRTGNIVKILSENQAVIRDKVYGDIAFSEDVIALSVKKKGSGFRSYFHIGELVYFDIEVDDAGHVRCTGIWIKKKQEADFNCSQPISLSLQTDLVINKEYKGTVIKMRPPFAFVVELDSPKIPVFVFNQAFKMSRHAPKLQRDEPVTHYISKGDKVYVKVYRNKGKKEFEWSAWDAWMDDSNANETNTKTGDGICRITKKKRRQRTCKSKEKTMFMKGRLSFIGTETAHLESTDCNGIVFFHRDNAFLFGVPVKGLRLDHIFQLGMVVILKCEHSSIIILYVSDFYAS